MANVGFVGIGAMGEAMAGHVLARGRDQVLVFDVRKEASAPLAAKGAQVVMDLAEMSRCAEIIIVMVVNDAQVLDVARGLSAGGRGSALIAVAATVRPATMLDVEKTVVGAGMRVIDAPVCWGLHGARDGKLASLCGGAAEDVETARPVLEAYSKSVYHIGPLGKGQLAKTINNMLHWAHNVTNYEALLLAKRHGLDPQKLREVLLQCPAGSATLEHWEKTLFTWPQKDMEIVQELVRQGDLVL
ncbi:MAG: NAD(P)-dependent oxidoreductase, partial [Vicinamibacteria bacterium]